MASKLPLLLLLIALTCLSQLFRVSNSVIAPELMRDLHLDTRQFGWAGSAFFLVQVLAAQARDRSVVGVRRLKHRHLGRRHAAGLGLAAVSIILTILFYVVVRDRPPGSLLPATHREPLDELFRGLWQVWRTKGLLPLLSMHFFAYATMLTVLRIWGGPYLFDVHKLGGVQRGTVLLSTGVDQTLGVAVLPAVTG